MAEDHYPKDLKDIAYSQDSSLNTLDIYIPHPPSQPTNPAELWLLYIHGGAWRDPTITSSSFTPIRTRLQNLPSITAYASLNYRLSPYPTHPTAPSNPSDPSRNAKHPDHITDVLSAILYLQEHYHSSDRYILVGHSVGATLALQVAMKRFWGSQYESTFALELNVVPPVAIVGLEGIYDIPALVEAHREQSVYRDFVANAVEPKDWEGASPARWEAFGESWADGRVVVLAHSPNDSLVEVEQAELMRRALEAQGFVGGGEGDDSGGGGERSVRMCALEGDHDEVWQTGEASKAVEMAVKLVLGLS